MLRNCDPTPGDDDDDDDPPLPLLVMMMMTILGVGGSAPPIPPLGTSQGQIPPASRRSKGGLTQR